MFQLSISVNLDKNYKNTNFYFSKFTKLSLDQYIQLPTIKCFNTTIQCSTICMYNLQSLKTNDQEINTNRMVPIKYIIL